jgi:hypothetical protein
VSRRPVRAPFMIGLLILLAGLTIGNLRPAAPPPADNDEAAARFTIYLTRLGGHAAVGPRAGGAR